MTYASSLARAVLGRVSYHWQRYYCMIVEYETVATREIIYTLDSRNEDESMQGRYNLASVVLRAYSS